MLRTPTSVFLAAGLILLCGCHEPLSPPVSSITGSTAPRAAPASAASAKLPPPPAYEVVATEDVPGPVRTTRIVSVRIKDRHATPAEVHSALLAAAKTHPAQANVAFGFWPGDDVKGNYSAGRLVWSAEGVRGFGGRTVPSDGRFEAGAALK
jgi:hypothetical protein